MSKLKRVVSVLMVTVLMVGSMATPAAAQAQSSELLGYISIAPLWQNTTSAQVMISASGRTLNPGVAVTATNSNQRITGTLFLERQSGNSWVRVASWSVSGTGTVRDGRTFTSPNGGTYRARLSVTVGTDRIEQTSWSVRV